ncbi:hypothetical protein [Flavobacterium macacae]|uniref:DUF4870 domain-containing protein n=1 Tax=Flavobacterium macacae TaxID=2488993 RepID=A0A3P3W9Q2_9FLAO|nr:hypothetical protein [Flavobacterium macacae]RRJ91434.1 hypothetical protein EG849_08555 [Flavobacterium macacae]
MQNTVEEGKTIAIVSHLSIIGTIIAIVMNNDKKNTFATFHIRQTLGIFLLFFALGYPVGLFDDWMISSSLYIFIFILWAYSFVSALQGQMNLIPLLGSFFQKFFKNII